MLKLIIIGSLLASNVLANEITCTGPKLYEDGTRIEGPIIYNLYHSQLTYWPIKWGPEVKLTNTNCQFFIKKRGLHKISVTAQEQNESKRTEAKTFLVW